jgi:hypothetical protein
MKSFSSVSLQVERRQFSAENGKKFFSLKGEFWMVDVTFSLSSAEIPDKFLRWLKH